MGKILVCGILGVFSSSGLGGSLAKLIAADTLGRHRGPDGQGFIAFGECLQPEVVGSPERLDLDRARVVLGHRRLSIIDLTEAGRQPMGDSTGACWITYNGEIYNYRELRKELEGIGFQFRSQCDTEVVLNAWIAWGESCQQRFVGMWAFVIYDLRTERLFCSRDRFGIKPLHFISRPDYFAFASELKQLRPLLDRPINVNRQAVYEYLSFGTSDHAPHTFYNEVSRLLPGESLSVDLQSGDTRRWTWYSPEIATNGQVSLSDAADQFRALFIDSVRLQLRSDVEIGSCLSGGLDSSAIVCTANALLREAGNGSSQRTFSSTFNESEANEDTFREAVVTQTGVRQALVRPTADGLLAELDDLVTQQDEPFGSSSIYAQWCTYRAASQAGVKVMLDGQGADEMLAGYVGFIGTYLSELRQKREVLRYAHERLAWRWRHGRSPAGSHPVAAWLRADFGMKYSDDNWYVRNAAVMAYPEEERLNNQLYQMTMLNNLPSLLRYSDRSSMAFSVESRVPFLDHRLVEFVMSLPSSLKIRNGYTKKVLREAMSGVIPKSVVQRISKLGFATPERKWQMGPLLPLIERALTDPRMKEFIDPDGARAYLQAMEASGATSFIPWRWLNLSRWMALHNV